MLTIRPFRSIERDGRERFYLAAGQVSLIGEDGIPYDSEFMVFESTSGVDLDIDEWSGYLYQTNKEVSACSIEIKPFFKHVWEKATTPFNKDDIKFIGWNGKEIPVCIYRDE